MSHLTARAIAARERLQRLADDLGDAEVIWLDEMIAVAMAGPRVTVAVSLDNSQFQAPSANPASSGSRPAD